MGHRIEEGYREKLGTLLAPLRLRRPGPAVERLIRGARLMARREGITTPEALARVFERVRSQVLARQAGADGLGGSSPDAGRAGAPRAGSGAPPRFVCDANLGGLARWLRAAGYEAWFGSGIEDSRLVEQARRQEAVLVTGDVGIMRRRPVRAGAVRAVWIPSSLSRLDQLEMLLRELGLARRAPRCMACGGELRAVAKHEVAERIPPRTARWKDEYFVCAVCDKLFWQGTHWVRIVARLERLAQRP